MASAIKHVARVHNGAAGGSGSAGNTLASYSTNGIHARRAKSHRKHSRGICGSVSSAWRQKGRMSDRGMACPAALPAVHVTPASIPWRMLRSPFQGATYKPSLQAY